MRTDEGVAMTTHADGRGEVRVQEVMDDTPMSPRRWGVVLASFVVALLDGFDTQSIAFIGSSIADDFGMSTVDMTWVITASTVGMALGAMTLGSWGDRIGRRRAILVALALFGTFSLLGAFATAPWQIVLLRFLIGLGMGGATPSLLALAAEFTPVRRRGVAMTLVLLGLPGGALLGGLVAAQWLPVLGWRGMFLLGGVLPIVMMFVMTGVPESPAFLASRGGERDLVRARRTLRRTVGVEVAPEARLVPETGDGAGERASVRALFDPAYRTVTVAVWAVYLANWIAWFLLLQWMPTALGQLGLPKATAALGTSVVNGAFIVAAIPLSLVLPRVRPRVLLLVMFACGIATTLGLGLAGDSWGLVFALLAVAGFGVGGQQLVLNFLVANTYPTRLRGTATGYAIGVGRLGSIVGSALGGVLLGSLGPSGYFAALAVPLVLAAAATLLVRPTVGSVAQV